MTRNYPIRPPSRAANFIARRVHDLQGTRTQKEIARLAGLKSVNMIPMLKNGTAKVPLDRVVRLAAALDCDAGHLFRLTLETIYDAETLEAFYTLAATATSRNERGLLWSWRSNSADRDPAFTDEHQRAIERMFHR
jgi:transcriptional regulator with XRE-family HTH domain